MFPPAYESQEVAPYAPVTLFPNLDTPSNSESGRDDVGDPSQLPNQLALDDIKPSSLPPNKRRKLTQSSPAISQEFPSSSVPQALPLSNRTYSLEPASFAGGDTLLYSDSPVDQGSSPEHALELAFTKPPPELLHISSSTSHGATSNSVMPDRQHDDEYTPTTLVNAQRDTRIQAQGLLGESHSSGVSRQHESCPSESAHTSSSSSLAPPVSRLSPITHPISGRSTRVSTQILTQRSKELAAHGGLVDHWGFASHGQLGTRSVKTSGVLSAFVKSVAAPGLSSYHANAHELELWTNADVSPVVFGKRKFAKRLSEEEFKNAVTFNLRHLVSEVEEMSGAQRPQERSSGLTAMGEKSRKGRVSMIIKDALELEEQSSVEETNDGFSTDVPSDLQEGMDTSTNATDTDEHDSKVIPLSKGYKLDSRSARYNTHSLSFQKSRRSFLLPSRYKPSPSTTNTQRIVFGEHAPSSLLPQILPISTQDSILSTRSTTPFKDNSINSATSSVGPPSQGNTGRLSEEFPREPFQAPKKHVPSTREFPIEVIELISPMIVDEDSNMVYSPPAQSSLALHQNIVLRTNSRPPREGPSNPPLPRGESTPSSLFGSIGDAETSIDSPPPSEAIHNVPPSSVPLSEDDLLETSSKGLPMSPRGKFFHDYSIQTSEDPPNTTAVAQGIVFRRSANPANSRVPDVSSWPSPAAPEDHPYLQEARSLMVTAKLREGITLVFVENDQHGTKEDEDSGVDGESEIEDVDELNEQEDFDPIESEGTEDELDTLSVFPLTTVAAGRHDNSLPHSDAHMTPSLHGRGLHRRVNGWESISTSGARGRGFNTEPQSTHVPPAVSPIVEDNRDSDQAEDGEDQFNHEDQLEDWTASLQTLVKGKRVLLPEELLNLKTVLNAVYVRSPTISPLSELAQAVLQVAKLEAKDIPNQDSLGLRSLARKSLRAWGLSTRTKP